MQNRAYKFLFLIGLAILSLAAGALFAQEPRPEIEPRPKPPQSAAEAESQRLVPNLRIDTNLVLIPVTVTTPLNQFVTGMEKENFRLTEDKVEQDVSYFASFDAPLSIGQIGRAHV